MALEKVIATVTLKFAVTSWFNRRMSGITSLEFMPARLQNKYRLDSSKKLCCCEQTCALLREIFLLSTGKPKVKSFADHDASTANSA